MRKLTQKTSDVYSVEENIFSIGAAEIDFLKSKLSNSSKGRVRINLHPKNSDLLHEMIIILSPDSYIRPHKHPKKSEAFHLIYGAVDVVLFDSVGNISKVIPLAANDHSKPFYYRMSEPTLHTLIVRSDLLVVHEITNGPFIEGATIYAEFAPLDTEVEEVRKWMNNLHLKLLESKKS
ncbi:MAG: WbuC family cupin fold metalloprotein [Betaproteobacteria bacterium]